jgi:hypothetical protein
MPIFSLEMLFLQQIGLVKQMEKQISSISGTLATKNSLTLLLLIKKAQI